MNTLDVLYSVAGIALAPVWARKSRSGWRERFGHTPPIGPSTSPAGRLMLHAVSVGEVNALRALVPLLANHCDLVVSASTDTGLARATELFAATCRVVRYPLDFTVSVRRFLNAVKPDAVGLVELEVWPNFVAECAKRSVPVCVINGRLSERSFRGYRAIRPFIGPTFRRLTRAAVQDEEYAARFRAMGVAPERCSVTGSMKWDAARIEDTVPGAQELGIEMGIDPQRPLVVAGSTGPDEEALLHGACPEGVQLLCAPRKPARFDQAAAALPGCVCRSRVKLGDKPHAGATRFLLDTIGELRRAYSLADVVVIGRSFGDLHGSDPIEPIALGKPTVIGPSYGDFRTVVDAFREANGIVVSSPAAIAADLARLLQDPLLRKNLAESGRSCVRANQGATVRHQKVLLDVLATASRPNR